MAQWIRVCSIRDCPPGTALEVVADQRIVALFRTAEAFHALDGICPHQGGPLGRGTLEGCTVTCPWHGWQFDVTTGRHRTIPSLCQPSLPVRIVDEDVWVDVDA
jgi:nitrite reductase/ring-hydroxylating ferredoxin subunit